jgi:hypothetical protein
MRVRTRAAAVLKPGHRGLSTLFVLCFCAFLLGPVLLLALGIGRFAHAQSVLATAADAAALAAAQSVDVDYYRLTGEIRFEPWTRDEAWIYAMKNSEWLVARDIHPEVTTIKVHQARHVVEVTVRAEVRDLFPAGIGPGWIQRTAEAEVAVLHEIFPP